MTKTFTKGTTKAITIVRLPTIPLQISVAVMVQMMRDATALQLTIIVMLPDIVRSVNRVTALFLLVEIGVSEQIQMARVPVQALGIVVIHLMMNREADILMAKGITLQALILLLSR